MASRSSAIKVNVTGDARDAIKAISKTTGELFTLQKRASMVGSAIGNLAAKGIASAVNVVRDYAGAVASTSDSMDKFRQTMSFAGIDTKAIDQASKATRDYADQTVYDLTTVQNTTAQLAANGIKDYVGLTKAAGNLNAVSGGSASTFQSVAMVLTQTAGAGKLTTENWNQLADAIPGASGRLQEAMKANGAYTGNFRQAMEKGEISADEFNQAIMQLGMEDVAQKAATSTETMEGAFGNLEAAIVGGLADAFNQVKPMVTDAMSAAADAIGTYGGQASKALGEFISGITGSGAFQALTSTIDAVGKALQDIGGAISDVVTTIAPGLGEMSGSAGSMGKTVGDAFKIALAPIQGVAKALSAVGSWVQDNAEPIAAGLAAIAGGFAAFKVATIITSVVSALKGFSGAAQAAAIAQAALNVVMNANPLMLVVTAIGAVVGALTWFFTQTEAGKAIWESFTSFIGDCVNGIIGFFQSLPGKIGAFFNNAASAARNAWNGIVGFFGNIWGGITSGVSSIVGSVRNAFNNAVNAAKNAFNGLVSFVQGIWDRITGIFDSIGNAAKGAWDTITSWLPFSRSAMAPMATTMADMPSMLAAPIPLVAVGGADSQGSSHGSGTRDAQLLRMLDHRDTPTVTNNITYNVTLPSRALVGSRSELIRWIRQGLAEAERQVR